MEILEISISFLNLFLKFRIVDKHRIISLKKENLQIIFLKIYKL